MEQATRQRIVKNVTLSLFIFLLPIALMFVSFYITGERPWLKKQQTKQTTKSITNKNTQTDGGND